MTDQPIRVLWTSNVDLPAVAPDLGLTPTPFGGWLSLMTDRLAGLPRFEIGVAMRSESRKFRRVEKNGIIHFALPQQRDRFDVAQADVERVLSEFRPDILHVEGAEMRHARRFLSSWMGPGLLSMQGVLNGYARYELGRLPIVAMLNPLRPWLMLTALALLTQRHLRFLPRLASECSAMRMADHVSGRTLWDRAQAKALAPEARYHHCARILRDVFYTRQWQADAAEPGSIFIGNAASPRKGAHVAVQALSLLVRDFPDARLYIAGEDPRCFAWRSLKRHVGYPVYLLHLVRKLDLEDRVHFTGVLSGPEMADRMARSHVCLMASIIENSPNTLGEAMIMGVPTVSAYAGGAPSMARDEIEALFYRADDPVMLAFQVRRIFEDSVLAARLGQAARARALETHDPERNLDDLVATYEAIMADASGGQA
ncbi:glycosyltransferase family 4 protein [Halomonas daqiaonensis]|uniref:Glycosyltransferase involved in cell wall bisynthesis n=1 Tax=Halomonas daqiaonensis TaxID=650850 RepID=A0A1H7HMD0_9GAMM|nr:glycosyltransferase [Halomonas daqiaonensis]SEK50160.1 Glycosyltransferase involved in cell wall bisynthesis [Halomonas daqiaonensis]